MKKIDWSTVPHLLFDEQPVIGKRYNITPVTSSAPPETTVTLTHTYEEKFYIGKIPSDGHKVYKHVMFAVFEREDGSKFKRPYSLPLPQLEPMEAH